MMTGVLASAGVRLKLSRKSGEIFVETVGADWAWALALPPHEGITSKIRTNHVTRG
jgi:hypothetical protein